MKKIICLLFFSISMNFYCQSNLFYSKYINDSLIGVKQIEKNIDSSVNIVIYLGKLVMRNEKSIKDSIVYHVISNFYTISASIEMHGHSKLIFINNEGKLIKSYTFNMPNELPIGIHQNGLNFDNTTIHYDELPVLLCIPSGECFE